MSSSSSSNSPLLDLILDNLDEFRQYCTDQSVIEEYYNKRTPLETVHPTRIHPSSSSEGGDTLQITIGLVLVPKSFTRPEDPIEDDFEFHIYDLHGVSNAQASKTPGVDQIVVVGQVDPSHSGPASLQINAESPFYSPIIKRYETEGPGIYEDLADARIRIFNERRRLTSGYITYLAQWLSDFWMAQDNQDESLINDFHPPGTGEEFDPFEHARQKLVAEKWNAPETSFRASVVSTAESPAKRLGVEGRNFLGVSPEAWMCMNNPPELATWNEDQLKGADERNSRVTILSDNDYKDVYVIDVDEESGTVIVADSFSNPNPATIPINRIWGITGEGIEPPPRLYYTLPREREGWFAGSFNPIAGYAILLGFEIYSTDGSFDCRSFATAANRYLRTQITPTCPNAKIYRLKVPAHAVNYVELGGCDGHPECDPNCCEGSFVYEPQTGETWDSGGGLEEDLKYYHEHKKYEVSFEDVRRNGLYKLSEEEDGSDLDTQANRIGWHETPDQVERLSNVICGCLEGQSSGLPPNSNEKRLLDKCQDGTIGDWLKDNLAPGDGKTQLDDPSFARPLSCDKFLCRDGGCTNAADFYAPAQELSEDECNTYCREYFGCPSTQPCLSKHLMASSSFFPFASEPECREAEQCQCTPERAPDCGLGVSFDPDTCECCPPGTTYDPSQSRCVEEKTSVLQFGSAHEWFSSRLGEIRK